MAPGPPARFNQSSSAGILSGVLELSQHTRQDTALLLPRTTHLESPTLSLRLADEFLGGASAPVWSLWSRAPPTPPCLPGSEAQALTSPPRAWTLGMKLSSRKRHSPQPLSLWTEMHIPPRYLRIGSPLKISCFIRESHSFAKGKRKGKPNQRHKLSGEFQGRKSWVRTSLPQHLLGEEGR